MRGRGYGRSRLALQRTEVRSCAEFQHAESDLLSLPKIKTILQPHAPEPQPTTTVNQTRINTVTPQQVRFFYSYFFKD